MILVDSGIFPLSRKYLCVQHCFRVRNDPDILASICKDVVYLANLLQQLFQIKQIITHTEVKCNDILCDLTCIYVSL